MSGLGLAKLARKLACKLLFLASRPPFAPLDLLSSPGAAVLVGSPLLFTLLMTIS